MGGKRTGLILWNSAFTSCAYFIPSTCTLYTTADHHVWIMSMVWPSAHNLLPAFTIGVIDCLLSKCAYMHHIPSCAELILTDEFGLIAVAKKLFETWHSWSTVELQSRYFSSFQIGEKAHASSFLTHRKCFWIMEECIHKLCVFYSQHMHSLYNCRPSCLDHVTGVTLCA